MSGSIDYGILLDRPSGAFEIQISYNIPAYNDPETGEQFYTTSWNYNYYDANSNTGGGTGGNASEGDVVTVYVGFPPGEQVADATLYFSAQNQFSADSVSMEWHILNAGYALQSKSLIGGAGLDIIIGGSADDVLRGRAGQDYLDAGDGDDILDGGDGADQLFGGAGDDIMIGGGGDDHYEVDSPDDVIVERDGGGNEWVLSWSNYTLGAFVDSLSLVGVAVNGTGNEQANRIDGNDSVNVLAGMGGDDQLYGYLGNDTLRGGSGDDLLDGGTGNDRLEGGVGDDHFVVSAVGDKLIELAGEGTDEARVLGVSSYTLGENVENLTNISEFTTFRGTGNAAANVMSGGSKVDVLNGAAGNDQLNGQNGDDVLLGGLGGDQLIGGLGSDAASYANATVGVAVNLATGVGTKGEAVGDSFVSIERLIGSGFNDALTGDALANRLEGGAGNDTLRGGAGMDWIKGGAGADVLDGGADDDGVSYSGELDGVTINLQTQTASGGYAQGDTLLSFLNAEGSEGDDTLIGSTLNNLLIGRLGNDTLDGGAGNDTIRGGKGADVLTGGAGSDLLDYSTSSAAVTIDLGTGVASGGDAQGDTFSDFDRVQGSSFGDSLTGDGLANVLIGGAGDDVLRGGGGNDTVNAGLGADTMDGGTGIDTLSYAGSTSWVSVSLVDGRAYGAEGQGDTFIGFENLRGSEVGDALYGDANNNRIEGGKGGDYIIGGGGSDTLFGGSGDDAFSFSFGSDQDRVMDFLPGGGWEDRIIITLGNDYDSFSEVMAVAKMVGDDTVIDFAPGLRLILDGVDKANLTAMDFVFDL